MDPTAFTAGRWHCDGGRGSYIGRGAFSDVYLAKDKETGEKVALKVYDLSRLNRMAVGKQLLDEVGVLKQLSPHKNVVTLKGMHEDGGEMEKLYLAFDYCDGGDLSHHIAAKKMLSEEETRHLMIQFAEGLYHLHKMDIVHRDLKPSNILLHYGGSPSPTLKIADFGFARFLSQEVLAQTMCGTPLYMAPEILNGKQYNRRADLWSVGAIMYEMLVGRPLFNVKNQAELMSELAQPVAMKALDISHVSDSCKNLLLNLLERDHSLRISWDRFFEHQWLRHRPRTTSVPVRPDSFATSPPPQSQSPRNRTSSVPVQMLQQQQKPSRGFSEPVDKQPQPYTTSSMYQSQSSNYSLRPQIRRQPPAYLYRTDLVFDQRELEKHYTRATCIGRIAQTYMDTQGKRHYALILYLEAAQILHDVIVRVKQEMEAFQQTVRQLYNKHNEFTRVCRYLYKHPEIQQTFAKYGAKAVSSYELIYQHALHLGRDAAVGELLSTSPDKAVKLYRRGLALLEYLLDNCPADSPDRETLRSFVHDFHQRIEQSEESMTYSMTESSISQKMT